MKYAVNTFDKGMNQDFRPSMQPPGTYRYAMNGIHETDQVIEVLANEQMPLPIQTYQGKLVGFKRLPNEDKTLLFINNGASELWLFDHQTYEKQKIASDDEFDCDWMFSDDEWIESIEIKYLEECAELHVYWSSGCHYWRANLTLLLDQNRRKNWDCEDFRLFTCQCVPTAQTFKIAGGNDLLNGAYQFTCQLETTDGAQTNWFKISNPIFLGSNKNRPGERSSQAVRVVVNGLSPDFAKVNIAVIKTINGTKSAFFLDTFGYSTDGIAFDYYAQGQEKREMNLEEIFIKRKAYIKGRDLVHKDNRLYLYNTLREKNLHYQPHANNIRLTWARFEVPQHIYKETPEKFPSLMRDEIYCFGIQPQYCDGTVGPVYQIPGPTGDPVEECVCGSGGTSTTAFAARSSTSGLAQGDCQSGEGFFNGDCIPCSQLTTAQRSRAAGCEGYSGATLATEGQNPGEGLTSSRTAPNRKETQTDPKIEEYYDTLKSTHEDLNTEPSEVEACEDCAGSTNAPGDVQTWGDLMGNHMDTMSDRLRQDGEVKVSLKDSIDSPREFLRNAFNLDNEPPNVLTPKPDWTENPEGGGGTSAGTAAFRANTPEKLADCLPSVYNPEVIDTGEFEPAKSQCHTYPQTLDCDGEPIFRENAGQPLRFHKTPRVKNAEICTINYSGTGHNSWIPKEFGSSGFIYPLGVVVENVYQPTENELPKPLCDKEPWKLVMVKREAHNRTVVAKGLFTGTFRGDTYGVTHYFPRHAVNSIENVDRHIEDEPGGNHIGDPGPTTAYMFHSPDTNMRRVPLSATYVKPEYEMYGNGYRYGMYAQGEKVSNAFENQIDQRGARQAINLNWKRPLSYANRCISGITYAPADTIVEAGDGITYPLNNSYRESSVLVELESQIGTLTKGLGNHEDASFVGDGLDHHSPIKKAAAIYGALRQNSPCIYGSVETMRYIDTGLTIGTSGTATGLVGDTYIAPYTIKRTGYVSDKVGEKVENDGGFELTQCSDPSTRDVCDPLNLKGEKLKQYAGFDDYTRHPTTGEPCDARNYANLHPGKYADDAYGNNAVRPETDFYYANTVTTLLQFWVETDVNLPYRMVGDDELMENFFPKIFPMELDAGTPQRFPWERGWLMQFYREVRRPSKYQMALKAFIRTILTVVVPMLAGSQVASIDDPLQLILTAVASPFLIALFSGLESSLWDQQRIEELLGVPQCRTDEDQGTADADIRGFRDNFHKYNGDYQQLNDVQPALAMPDPFNTCSCDDCDTDTSLEVPFSDEQILTSPLDAWRNFRANNYLSLPARTGKIQKMFVMDSQFYAHTTDGLWVIQYKNGTIQLDNVRSLLAGGNDLLAQPQQYMEGAEEGFLGTNDPNAGMITQIGALIVDQEARKLFIFNQGAEDMTMSGMRQFFRKYLAFSERNNKTDERVDNYYLFGMDYRHNRILFTKRGELPFTLSYDFIRKQWISFHSYLPDGYFNDRGKLFSYKEGVISLHNAQNKYLPFDLEYIVNHENIRGKQFQHAILETEAYKGLLQDRKITFNKAVVSNDTQSSGILKLKVKDSNNNDGTNKDTYPEITMFRQNNEWRFTDIRDITVNPNEPIWVVDWPYRKPNTTNLQITNAHLKQGIVQGQYLSMFFTFDDRNDIQLIVRYAITGEDQTII